MTAPVVALGGCRLEELELIVKGLLPGVSGYRLPCDGEWPQLRLPSAEAIAIGREVHLCDPENTPIAKLLVKDLADAGDSCVWVAGPVRGLRRPEHGPVREFRFQGGEDLSADLAAIFTPDPRPADVLRAVQEARGRRLVFVAQGSGGWAQSARLVQILVDATEFVPGSRVYFVPESGSRDTNFDATVAVLKGLGAGEIIDFRQPSVVHGGGGLILFTGLSGSGKSTIARGVADRVSATSSRRVALLDGDRVRRALASELGFGAADRHTNLLRQAWVGARIAEVGGIAICAPIAPFAASRAAMRAQVGAESTFLTVYISTPLEVAEARDRKGLYAKARAGLIPEFTGISSPYEVPADAELIVDASVLAVEECVNEVIELLTRYQLL